MSEPRRYGRGSARPAPMPAEELRKLLSYDRQTGVLTWKDCAPGGQGAKRVKPGAVAGCANAYGYLVVRVNKVLYPAHRLAWYLETGEWPPEQIDHRNEAKGDNRWDNLRLATHAQNNINRKGSRPNTSGYRGVTRFRNGWKAQINVNGRTLSFPTRTTAEEAYSDYVSAALKHHGQFARLS